MLLRNINPSVIKELKSLRIDLSIFWGLELSVERDKDTLSKFDWITKHLIRKNWINEELEPTNLGLSIYNELISSNTENKEVKARNKIKEANKESSEGFSEWWKCYPASNRFVYQGRTFTGSQAKRLQKESCEDIWNNMISSGEFTAEQIISGTKKHFQEAKKESVRENRNQLTYIPNSERYLRERIFESFITEEEIDDEDDNGGLFREIELD